MNMQNNIVETADRHSRKRAVLVTGCALLFGVLSGCFWNEYVGQDSSPVLFVMWLLFAAIAVLLLLTGGGLFKDRRVRNVMNDELSLAHRRSGIGAGFFVAMIAGVTLLAVSGAPGLSGRLVAFAIVSSALTTALGTWGVLELRSMRES
jgi:hypothetical protein